MRCSQREVVVDAALAIVQVGMADAARLNPDERLVRTGIGDVDGHDFDGRAAFAGDDALNLVWNDRALVRRFDG